MTRENVVIYVDNRRGDNNNDGTERDPHGIHGPVATADKAFSLLPPSWHGRAEIIFAVTDIDYTITASAVYFGTPIGPDASSLVIRGDHREDYQVTATGGTRDEVLLATRADIRADQLIGKVLTRLSSDGRPVGPAISIRGNSDGGVSSGWTIKLQRSIDPIVQTGDTFSIQRPAVTLVPDPPPHYPDLPTPSQGLTLTSHDGRSPNLMLVGLRIAPKEGRGLNLLNVRAQCDTCEFSFRRSTGREPLPTIFYIHSDSRIQGGIEGDPEREQAGAFIRSDHTANAVWAIRGGVLGGHLTFNKITVRASQGGVFVPKSLEALEAPIQILAGGSALAEPQKEAGAVVGGWGTESNKARIRTVSTPPLDGDGLRVFNGGTINSPLSPIQLDIYGFQRDGIRLDVSSFASFGSITRFDPATGTESGGETGLFTTGTPNRGFGLNVRNGSRALIGTNETLTGIKGDVGLDDSVVGDAAPGRGWAAARRTPRTNARMSLVCLNSGRPV